MQLDLLTIGRSGVDLYPLQTGVGLEDVTTFGKYLGGSATNVAVAAARLGNRTAVLTAVGDDPLGRFVTAEIARLGAHPIAPALEGRRTPITLCEIFPPDDFPLYFYRDAQTPDLAITPDLLPDVAAPAILWVTLSGFSREPSRTTHVTALERRGRARHTVIDLDYRPTFWDDPAEARTWARTALSHATVAVGNREECEVATGETEPHRAADALLAAGVTIAVVKQGPAGTLVATADERHEVPPTPTTVVNGLGAGDAFGGALCHGLLRGWPLRRTIEVASTAGAIVAGALECAAAMPTLPELLARAPGGAS